MRQPKKTRSRGSWYIECATGKPVYLREVDDHDLYYGPFTRREVCEETGYSISQLRYDGKTPSEEPAAIVVAKQGSEKPFVTGCIGLTAEELNISFTAGVGVATIISGAIRWFRGG